MGSVLVLGLLLFIAVACSGSASFQGTDLGPGDVAPPFRLQDQFGGSVGLSDLAGKVVVLTFLYTHCPDVCPIMSETLRRAHLILGDDASQMEMVAISLDPQRDSVERAYQYSQERDMLNRWRFLVGSEEQLTPIWRSYWLDPVRDVPALQDDSLDDNHDEGSAGTTLGAGATPRHPVGDYLVTHSAPVFLIDRQGYRRVLFTDLSLDPQPLVHDIRLLTE